MKKLFCFVVLCFLLFTLISCNAETKKADNIWRDYISSGEASEMFVSLYKDADKIDGFPVYSYETLEATSFKVCVFYNKSEVIGIRTVRVEYLEGGNAVIVEEEMDNQNTLYNDIKSCVNLFPKFKIMGLRADATKTKLKATTFFAPFGINDKDEYICEYDTLYKELDDFPFVSKRFKTVEEGKKLLQEYWQTREQIEESIIRFGESDNPRGYYLVYGNIDNYDNIIACPLISDSGGCIAHLLYLRNKLVAEIVIKEAGDGYEELLHRGDKKSEESGEYPDLGESLYMGAIKEFKAKNPDTDIKGVSFDGEKYTVVS